MRQERFVRKHEAEWQALERWLDARAGSARRARASRREWHGLADHEMPARYRRLCQQLALARRRGYSPAVVARLQRLMQRGHEVLYRAPAPRWRRALEFLLADFPRLVRAERACMLAAAALFWLPLLAIFVAIQLQPELSASLFDPAQLLRFESMYDPADPSRKLGRDSGTDLGMFGYYIWNNVSIGFRTFAGGLLAGVGAMAVLVANGVTIGGIAGHLQAVGHGDPFWRFVAGHSAPELTAIVIAGGAGLRLGLALVAPGRLPRGEALRVGGRRGARLCLGVLAMLVFAAFVEAFWSSIGWMPAGIKYAAGAALWGLTGVWLWRGGRDRDDEDEDAAP
ncbi:stage II sporulation protein M [Vulcaniibacterium tengchongense]|uniref:Putative membrane protein SpoIIM required for sporulation n=1 Tax=Vulcaniibacterium tengchongense TaxID=1273429 RepID=A0A3N4VJL8_9GAMM|nr:stage II sporulation protein M [Vulcaniibacterium tengchongense]RPE79919.1 putative membrane protein SpoIIM required for sporulation [Vulcaniibacterium tengchongense]